MGQSGGLIWPEAVQGGDEHYGSREQPELESPVDWANWRGRLEESHEADLQEAGCGALLAAYVQDLADDEIEWTSPAEMAAAAERLMALVRDGGESVAAVLEEYDAAVEEYRDDSESATPPREQFLRELAVVKKMAQWAERLGKTKIAFEIG